MKRSVLHGVAVALLLGVGASACGGSGDEAVKTNSPDATVPGTLKVDLTDEEMECLGMNAENTPGLSVPPNTGDPYEGLAPEVVEQIEESKNRPAAGSDVTESELEQAEAIVSKAKGLEVLVSDKVARSATRSWSGLEGGKRGVALLYSAEPAVSIPMTYSDFASSGEEEGDYWIYDDAGMPIVKPVGEGSTERYEEARSIEVFVDLRTESVYAVTVMVEDVYNACRKPTKR